MSITDKELRAIIRGVASVVNKQFAALEARIAKLEPPQKLKTVHRGAWRPGSYQPGESTVHENKLWICQGPTAAEPSHRFADWKVVGEKHS